GSRWPSGRLTRAGESSSLHISKPNASSRKLVVCLSTFTDVAPRRPPDEDRRCKIRRPSYRLLPGMTDESGEHGMAERAHPRPTDGELAILRVLWREGPCTVRQVQEALGRDRPTGYTTALKLLQVMAEKGLVLRDESQRTHVYRARSSEEQTQ